VSASRRGDGRVPVAVFAKPPVAGDVKTRLARALGAERAARLAAAFLRDTWAVVRALPWARPVLATTTTDPTPFGLGGDVELWQQGDGDLGERMERTLARALGEAPAALLIGADAPALPASHLDAARAALGSSDVVLGPSEDGGFYLIGATRLPEGSLAGLPWSRADSRLRTEAQLTARGLRVARAPEWFDVDEARDLARLGRVLAEDPRAAPATRAALAELG
jgi:rSAM/selenodomain-associated transferase 1